MRWVLHNSAISATATPWMRIRVTATQPGAECGALGVAVTGARDQSVHTAISVPTGQHTCGRTQPLRFSRPAPRTWERVRSNPESIGFQIDRESRDTAQGAWVPPWGRLARTSAGLHVREVPDDLQPLALAGGQVLLAELPDRQELHENHCSAPGRAQLWYVLSKVTAAHSGSYYRLSYGMCYRKRCIFKGS